MRLAIQFSGGSPFRYLRGVWARVSKKCLEVLVPFGVVRRSQSFELRAFHPVDSAGEANLRNRCCRSLAQSSWRDSLFPTDELLSVSFAELLAAYARYFPQRIRDLLVSQFPYKAHKPKNMCCSCPNSLTRSLCFFAFWREWKKRGTQAREKRRKKRDREAGKNCCVSLVVVRTGSDPLSYQAGGHETVALGRPRTRLRALRGGVRLRVCSVEAASKRARPAKILAQGSSRPACLPGRSGAASGVGEIFLSGPSLSWGGLRPLAVKFGSQGPTQETRKTLPDPCPSATLAVVVTLSFTFGGGGWRVPR